MIGSHQKQHPLEVWHCSCFHPFPKTAFDDALLILKSQSAGGTGNNAFTTVSALGFSNRLTPKSSDQPVKATVGKTEGAYTQTLPTYPNTPSTEHALVGVIDKYRTA